MVTINRALKDTATLIPPLRGAEGFFLFDLGFLLSGYSQILSLCIARYFFRNYANAQGLCYLMLRC
jgi:hypothetical protein